MSSPPRRYAARVVCPGGLRIAGVVALPCWTAGSLHSAGDAAAAARVRPAACTCGTAAAVVAPHLHLAAFLQLVLAVRNHRVAGREAARRLNFISLGRTLGDLAHAGGPVRVHHVDVGPLRSELYRRSRD